MLANVAVDRAAGQDVVTSQTEQDQPSVLRAARERIRAEITRQILDIARRHLATDGASGLSLRAIARELGASSSADLADMCSSVVVAAGRQSCLVFRLCSLVSRSLGRSVLRR